ncbi:MAG: LacI family DNA-binding transcriptional regulator, partial [Verrucomicrobiia bacterium]
CVTVDNLVGMRLVMEHLFELGHRRIAFVSGPLNSLLNHQRHLAYRLALMEQGLPVDSRLIKVDPNWILNQEQSHRDCVRFWDELFGLEDPPTAIAAAMDGFAAQMVRIASEKGVLVPSRLSITGFGDMQYTAFTDPPITTVRVDHRAIGELGALALLGMIDGATAPSQVAIRPSLVVRGSTGKCP